VVLRAERSPRAGFVRIGVADSGDGISAEDQARLWKPFSQLANARERGGSGLGLALSKQLVELMGGQVGLTSTVGAGSDFYIDLPIADGAAHEPAPRPAISDGRLALIIDDEAGARELLALALGENGFRTLTAATGEEALALARKHRPEVITLDVFLPTIDGWDVLRLLKADPETARIPVVVVSISSDRARAFSLGAVEHLVKPVQRDTLLEALRRRKNGSKPDARPLTVLAVDDDAKQLELYRATLEPRGFRVRTEQTGRGGLEAARREAVDVVLLDLVLPDLSGVELVAELRADRRTRSLPILLVTAHELSAEDRARLNDDLAATLAKGTSQLDELLAEIRRVVRQE
jgi:CheY-like chemotaxis protein